MSSRQQSDRLLTLLGTLAMLAACSGKAESNQPEPGSSGSSSSQAGQAPSGSGAATGAGAGGASGSAAGGAAGEGHVPCGVPTAGTGVIGGTSGLGGSDGVGGGDPTIYVDCSAYRRCSLMQGCGAGLSCYSIPGCKTPICATGLCDACPGECLYLLSLPGQLECQGAEYLGIEDESAKLPICS